MATMPQSLRQLYKKTVDEPVPDDWLKLLDKLP
jgi:hypothetical protein